MNVQKIAAKFGIDLVDAEQIVSTLAAGNDVFHIDDELFWVLNEHYMSSGEMPYEVASRGDPYAWITEQMVKEFTADEPAVWIDYDDTSVDQRRFALEKGETTFYIPISLLSDVQKLKYVRN